MDKFIIKIITSQLIVYILRCLIGFTIGYNLMIRLPQYELFWSLLSIILVISPEGKDSRRLTIERVKSNFIGSIVGLLCVLISPDENVTVIIFGFIITSLICHLFQVMNMARVAIVALLIILLQPHFSEIKLTPILRFSSVAIGCLIGLTITICTSMIIRKIKNKYGIPY